MRHTLIASLLLLSACGTPAANSLCVAAPPFYPTPELIAKMRADKDFHELRVWLAEHDKTWGRICAKR